MQPRWFGLLGMTLLVQAHWVSGADVPQTIRLTPTNQGPKIVLEQIASPHREMVKDVMDRAIVAARGPTEKFCCNPDHFCFFLDHPDRAVTAWRRLGARCVTISPRGPRGFAWTDEHGSEVVWETVLRTNSERIWYADGKVKAGPLLPFVPVKAVVVLRFQECVDPNGKPAITQQTGIYALTDSKSVAVVTKLFGNSTQRMLETGLEQLQLFFSGVSWYIHRHPEQTEMLLRE